MLITLENEAVRLTVDTLGAQMMSLRSVDGCEYLWQGNPDYWSDKAPTLFPFIARLYRNSYRFHGKSYPMNIHGFASTSEFVVEDKGSDSVTLRLKDTLVTYAMYPFEFLLDITYRLVGATVEITYCVTNKSRQTIHFAIGGHPGFCVPMEAGGKFEDYYLEFAENCVPDRIGFTNDLLMNGNDLPYHLTNGNRIPLSHGIFDNDAIILRNMAKEVTLRGSGNRSVTVRYPNMNYLGIWHWPKTDAPYVCIEPWTSLPGRQDVEKEISCKSDMIHLPAGEIYTNTWTISVT